MSQNATHSSDSRKAILDSLRQARAKAATPVAPRPPRRPNPDRTRPDQAAPDVPALVTTLEASGFEAPVCRNAEEFAAALARVVADNAVRSANLWTHPLLERLDVAKLLERAGVEISPAQREDDQPGCSCRRAAGADLGVCAADALVAETGSVIMWTGPGRPRATALLPPTLLVVCDPQDALADLTALVDCLDQQASQYDPSAFFCVTGPSGTGDIEFVLVRGAHGPPTVIALLADMPGQ